MTNQEMIAVLKAHRATIEANGATALFAFGSRMRGDNRDTSDLDVLIDHEPGLTLTQLSCLQRLLGKITGLNVDVTTRGSIHPLAMGSIERDAVQVY